MSAKRMATNAAQRYDQALQYARERHLAPDAPRPQPTAAWPSVNLACLERFAAWVVSSGTSEAITKQLYIPMAGHVLGLALTPWQQLDLDADLERAMDYVRAKQLSAEWTQMCRCALNRFRRFLRQARGLVEVGLCTPSYAHYAQGLPDWLVKELERYQHLRQAHWRPARLPQQITNFWQHHARFWRWLAQHQTLTALADVRRRHLLDYVDHQLVQGYAVSTINSDLRSLRGFLLFLQEGDYPVPQALLHMPSLKPPDSLPKFLTDEQVRRLRDDCEQQVTQAAYPTARRDALLSRAAFYLLWQAALRLGELEELLLEDLDLPGRKLMVRQGKGLRDRTVFLTDTTVRAVGAYLAVRGQGPDSHVFLYRNQPVKKDLVHSRIQSTGERVGVKVYPHKLRHTAATQLLNAGCRITSIQKLLGHRRLNSTMTYARVHDQTAAADYYAAMAHIEARLQLGPPAAEVSQPVGQDERAQLLELVTCMAEPDLTPDARLDLLERMRSALTGGAAAIAIVVAAHDANQRDPPVPVFVSSKADTMLIG